MLGSLSSNDQVVLFSAQLSLKAKANVAAKLKPLEATLAPVGMA